MEGLSKSKMFCCVSQCNSYNVKNTSLHYFPRDKRTRELWTHVLKIGKPITKYMQVCSLHFKESDYFPSTPLRERKRLKNGAIPSQKIPLRPLDLNRTSTNDGSRLRRYESRKEKKTASFLKNADGHNENEPENMVTEVTTAVEEKEAEDFFGRSVDLLLAAAESKSLLCSEDKAIQVNTFIETHTCSISEIINTDQKLIIYTGINWSMLKTIVQCVSNVLADISHPPDDNLEEKILLTLIKIRQNFSFRALAVLFNKSESTVRQYFHWAIPLLKKSLRMVIYWPTKEDNLASMPKCFLKYKKTRVVLDCTEIAVQKSKCLRCRIRTYSYYKSKHTIKFLIGVTPAGSVNYVSPAYGGRTSDKAIFNNENVIDLLQPFHEAIMVDKGFAIVEECESKGIELIRPPFLRMQQQLTASDAGTTASIARARVHVERTIQRIKIYKIVTETIEWHILPYIDDIMVVVCALVNLSKPILNDDKFLNSHK